MDGRLNPLELRAWRGMLRTHATLTKALDAELEAAHGLPLSSYEVLLHLHDAEGQREHRVERDERSQVRDQDDTGDPEAGGGPQTGGHQRVQTTGVADPAGHAGERQRRAQQRDAAEHVDQRHRDHVTELESAGDGYPRHHQWRVTHRGDDGQLPAGERAFVRPGQTNHSNANNVRVIIGRSLNASRCAHELLDR